ncbi:hypothetical protein HDE_10297 [Halotydeus destructor]|nr:hypothetical protein HDE_10297 [Halotydeus destructor]
MFSFYRNLSTIFSTSWLLFWPLCATVWGSESVARQSLGLVFALITADRLRQLGTLFDYLPVELTFIVLVFSQPYQFMPGLLITCYTIAVKYLLEPVLLYIELVQVRRMTFACGRKISSLVLDEYEESEALKYLILLLTAIIYAAGLYIIKVALNTATCTLFTHVALLLIVASIGSAIATWVNDEGVITNASLVFLCSAISLYISSATNLHRSPEVAGIWSVARDESKLRSFAEQVLLIPEITTTFTRETFSWLRINFGLWFWLVIGLRLILVRNWITCFTQNNSQGEEAEDEDSSLEDSRLHIRGMSLCVSILRTIEPATLSKVFSVLLYSQSVMQRTEMPTFHYSYVDGVSLMRMLQCLLLTFVYTANMCRKPDADYY